MIIKFTINEKIPSTQGSSYIKAVIVHYIYET